MLTVSMAGEDAGLEKTRRPECLHVLPRNAAIQRGRVEHFIERRFLDRFGSIISDHYPTLLSLQNEAGEVLAALGLRSAAGESLFLERYFDEPVEHVISDALGVIPARADILEMGNLASIGRSPSARLIAAAALYLATCRYRYAVVTATEELRRMLGSFGFAWRALGAPRVDRLPDLGRSWGRYYEQDPLILVGRIQQPSKRMSPFAHATRIQVYR
jgi:hypothetical protein